MTSPGKPRARRRRARRILWSILLVAGVASAVYILRHSWMAAGVELLLPQMLARRLTVPASLGKAEVREIADTLEIRLRDLDLGPTRDASLDLHIGEARVRFRGWRALFEGLAGIQNVDLFEVSCRYHRPRSPPEEEPFTLPDLMLRALPTDLPPPPFPVRVHHFVYRQEGVVVQGDLWAGPEEVTATTTWSSPLPWDRITARARFGGGGLTRIEVSAEPGPLILSGSLIPGTRSRDQEGRPAGDWNGEFSLTHADGRGRLDLALTEGKLPAGRVELHLENLGAWAERFAIPSAVPDSAGVELSLSPENGVWRVLGTIATPEGDVRVSGTAARESFQLQFTVSSIHADVLTARAFPELEAHGLVSAVLEVGGVYHRPPALKGEFHLRDAGALWRGNPIELNTATVRGEWAPPQPPRLESAHLRAYGGEVTARGQLAGRSSDWDLDIDVTSLELAELRPWFPSTRDLRGKVSGRGLVRGPASQPRLTFAGELTDGEFAPAEWERMRNISARFRASAHGVELDQVHAEVGGGQISARGAMAFADGQLERYALTADLDRVRLFRSADVRVRGSGTIEFSGTADTAPTLRGEIEIVRGIYDRNIHPQLNVSGAARPFDLFRIEEGWASRLQFDLAVKLSGGFLVRNNRVDIAPVGELQLRGEGRQPILTGVLNVTSGRVKLPHLKLEVQRGEVQFDERDPYHPTIAFRGTGRIGAIEIESVASGDLVSPTVTFTSNPYLPEEELLLLIATGFRRREISDGNLQWTAALELTRLYGPAAYDEVFGQSRGDSVLDRIAITTETAEAKEDETRIAVEVKVLDWLSVAGEQDHRGHLNFDVLFYYWLR